MKVEGHGPACDLWSVGVMAYALVGGEFPWYSTSRDVCGQMIKYSELKFPQEASVFVLFCFVNLLRVSAGAVFFGRACTVSSAGRSRGRVRSVCRRACLPACFCSLLFFCPFTPCALYTCCHNIILIIVKRSPQRLERGTCSILLYLYSGLCNLPPPPPLHVV